jgi:hypothetical protein
MPSEDLELTACTPIPVDPRKFNRHARLPYGCTPGHIRSAMEEYIEFLSFINQQLHSRSIPRLECFLMPANFSSIVGEFMTSAIPKYCPGLVKNNYHNGHPDMLPKDVFPGNSMQHGTEGIEVKASRHISGWQGHNPEDVWLLVFVFGNNTVRDAAQGCPPVPFRFKKVVGAQLCKNDWCFSGRSETSRRTITASVTRSGFEKMEANWIYRDE